MTIVGWFAKEFQRFLSIFATLFCNLICTITSFWFTESQWGGSSPMPGVWSPSTGCTGGSLLVQVYGGSPPLAFHVWGVSGPSPPFRGGNPPCMGGPNWWQIRVSKHFSICLGLRTSFLRLKPREYLLFAGNCTYFPPPFHAIFHLFDFREEFFTYFANGKIFLTNF